MCFTVDVIRMFKQGDKQGFLYRTIKVIHDLESFRACGPVRRAQRVCAPSTKQVL